ncbi:MAG: helix-hairpin-helix domain-containing protein [Pseudomonadota bacterium]
MGKKKKLGISSLVERVEQLVNDALKRIDTLQNQVNDLREQLMERAGFSDKPSEDQKSNASGGTKPKAASQSTSSKKQSAGKSGSSSGASKAGSGSGKAAKSSGKASSNDLTQIKGIGPATAKKMQAKGITSISQLANPSADDSKKLEEFRRLKSFPNWQAEAKKLL